MQDISIGEWMQAVIGEPLGCRHSQSFGQGHLFSGDFQVHGSEAEAMSLQALEPVAATASNGTTFQSCRKARKRSKRA